MKLKINTRSSHKKRSQEMHTVYCWVLIIGFEPLFRWHLHVGSFLVSFLSSSLSSLSLSFIFSFFLFSYSLSFSFSFFFFFILSLSFSFILLWNYTLFLFIFSLSSFSSFFLFWDVVDVLGLQPIFAFGVASISSLYLLVMDGH